MMFSELLKMHFCIFTPLEEQAVRLGVCSKCHKKTLAHRITNELGKCMQCTGCLRVFILPTDNTTDA